MSHFVSLFYFQISHNLNFALCRRHWFCMEMRWKYPPASCCNEIRFLHFKLTGYLGWLCARALVLSTTRHSTFYKIESFETSVK